MFLMEEEGGRGYPVIDCDACYHPIENYLDGLVVYIQHPIPRKSNAHYYCHTREQCQHAARTAAGHFGGTIGPSDTFVQFAIKQASLHGMTPEDFAFVHQYLWERDPLPDPVHPDE